MNFTSARAALVVKTAIQFAYRQEHGIPHTGHTVNRLLGAVSALIGQKVDIVGRAVSPTPVSHIRWGADSSELEALFDHPAEPAEPESTSQDYSTFEIPD